jgi:hypothetical protein
MVNPKKDKPPHRGTRPKHSLQNTHNRTFRFMVEDEKCETTITSTESIENDTVVEG